MFSLFLLLFFSLSLFLSLSLSLSLSPLSPCVCVFLSTDLATIRKEFHGSVTSDITGAELAQGSVHATEREGLSGDWDSNVDSEHALLS